MARPSCLILHGLGGGPYELEPIIEALRPEVDALAVPILPGHEGPGPRMPPSRWEGWEDEAERAFDDLAARGAPVAVVGFSTGATVALMLATRRPVARMALLAPFLAIRFSGWVPLKSEVYLNTVCKLMPEVPRRPPAVRDPAARKRLGGRSHFKTFSLKATLSALDLIARVRPLVPSITAPTLIIQGRNDTVVEPSGAAWLHEHLGSRRKHLAWMPRSDHVVALDHDRDEVLRLTRALVLGVEPFAWNTDEDHDGT